MTMCVPENKQNQLNLLIEFYHQLCLASSDLEHDDACGPMPILPLGMVDLEIHTDTETINFQAKFDWFGGQIEIRTFGNSSDLSKVVNIISDLTKTSSSCLLAKTRTKTFTRYTPPSFLLYSIFSCLVIVALALSYKTVKILANAK